MPPQIIWRVSKRRVGELLIGKELLSSRRQKPLHSPLLPFEHLGTSLAFLRTFPWVWSDKNPRLPSLMICYQSLSKNILGHVVVSWCPVTEDDAKHCQNNSWQNAIGNVLHSRSLHQNQLFGIFQWGHFQFLCYILQWEHEVLVFLFIQTWHQKFFWNLNTLCLRSTFIKFVITWEIWKLFWQGLHKTMLTAIN